MSLIDEIEMFQKIIKEDISLTQDYELYDDFDCLLKKWDRYKELNTKFISQNQGDEFLSLRKSFSKLSCPSLDQENLKLSKAIKNIHYEYVSDSKTLK